MPFLVQTLTFFVVFTRSLVLVSNSAVTNNAVLADMTYLLNIDGNPQVVIDIPFTSPARTFEIFTPDLARTEHWNISLALQQMTCVPEDAIVIMNPSQPIWTNWCTNTSSTVEPLVISGVSHVYVRVQGPWSFSTAKLVATIYYDTSDNCDCGENFCCTSKCPSNELSAKGMLVTSKANSVSPRCISSGLICNGLPNCGFPCPQFSEDESSDVCSPTATEENDVVDKRIWVYFVATLGALIGFGFIITFFVVYLTERNRRWAMAKETLNHQLSIHGMPVRNSIAESLRDNPPTSQEVSLAVIQTIQRMSMETDQIILGNENN